MLPQGVEKYFFEMFCFHFLHYSHFLDEFHSPDHFHFPINSSILNTFNFLIRFTSPITSPIMINDYVQYVTVSVVKQVPSYSKHCTKVCLNLVNLADCV